MISCTRTAMYKSNYKIDTYSKESEFLDLSLSHSSLYSTYNLTRLCVCARHKYISDFSVELKSVPTLSFCSLYFRLPYMFPILGNIHN